MKKFSKILIGVVVLVVVIATAILFTRQALNRSRASQNVVGVLTDLTSYTAEYGQQERAGLQVLADQMNSKIGASPLKLAVQDTKGSPKDAINGLNQILQTTPKLRLLFSALSSVSMAVLPITEPKGILVLCNATSKGVIDSAKNSIRNFPDPKQEIDMLFAGAIVPIGIRSIGIIYINDEYGQSMDKWVRERTTAEGIKLSYSEAYGFDTSDFRSLIVKLNQSGAESVLCVGYGSQDGNLIRQLKENGFTGQILAPALTINTDSVSGAAGDALNGVIFNGFDYQSAEPELADFVQSFERNYKGKQSDIGVLAYVGTKIILDNVAPDASPGEVMSDLQKKSPFSTILGQVAFDGRSFIYPLKLYSVKDGKVILFTAKSK